ncbi:MAG TPA: zf-HC2 domain-containing protein [Mycobacteriales bacterium]|nr:zf-HC2 domain-containing protein [Mycobacteriales bacterium]
MTHLEDLAAALVDNELSHDERDRALAHITHCGGCRAEVDAQRRLKAVLANEPDPAVTPALTARLLAVPRVAAGPTTPDVVRLRRRPRRSLRSRAATASALGVALVAGVAAAGGGSDGRPVRPPVESFVEEHTATTARLPLNDPAGSILLTTYGR